MPKIEARFFGHLRTYLPSEAKGRAMVEVPEDATVGVLLDQLGIPPQDPKILLVNGVHADRQHHLREGDRVSVFPPVAGG